MVSRAVLGEKELRPRVLGAERLQRGLREHLQRGR
jgi:hypothetical protein